MFSVNFWRAAGGAEGLRTEHLNLADREDDVGPGDHQGDVATRGVLGRTGDQDGVALLLGSRQPVTQRVVLVAGRVSNTDLHITDGKIVTAPRGYTNMFHSLKLYKTSVLLPSIYIDCIRIVNRQDVVTLEIFLCLHIARSQQLADEFITGTGIEIILILKVSLQRSQFEII